mmetsp:Transcript_73815/g.175725  ORF Transcript_73815/g.175725 Transcript_73815/m.175725 type:complete len:90 (+) Transcript_73815:167-436(+)
MRRINVGPATGSTPFVPRLMLDADAGRTVMTRAAPETESPAPHASAEGILVTPALPTAVLKMDEGGGPEVRLGKASEVSTVVGITSSSA